MKYCAQEALDHQIDVVVNDEADPIICELIDSILEYRDDIKKARENLSHIGGISYYDSTGDCKLANPDDRPIVKDLDTLPFINYDLFNLKDYIKTKGDNIYLGQIISQRGCPFPCNFCSERYLLESVRENSADYMVENVKYLHSTYGVNLVTFIDNNFTLSKKRTAEFCEKIIENGIHKKMHFRGQTNVKANINMETASIMKKAGFTFIALGIERMTEEGKRRINKYVPDEKILKPLQIFHDCGISVGANMLIGFPWDTKKIISEEKKLFESRAHLFKATHVSVLLPMPGTEYYDDYPVVHKWYLNGSFFKVYETYFAAVLNIYMGPDSLKLNQYGFSKETLGAIKNIYY